jgi:hypothetical protein
MDLFIIGTHAILRLAAESAPVGSALRSALGHLADALSHADVGKRASAMRKAAQYFEMTAAHYDAEAGRL